MKTKADLPNLHLLILLIFVKSLFDAEELFEWFKEKETVTCTVLICSLYRFKGSCSLDVSVDLDNKPGLESSLIKWKYEMLFRTERLKTKARRENCWLRHDSVARFRLWPMRKTRLNNAKTRQLTLWHRIPDKPKFQRRSFSIAFLLPNTSWSNFRPSRIRCKQTWSPEIVLSRPSSSRGNLTCYLERITNVRF